MSPFNVTMSDIERCNAAILRYSIPTSAALGITS